MLSDTLTAPTHSPIHGRLLKPIEALDHKIHPALQLWQEDALAALEEIRHINIRDRDQYQGQALFNLVQEGILDEREVETVCEQWLILQTVQQPTDLDNLFVLGEILYYAIPHWHKGMVNTIARNFMGIWKHLERVVLANDQDTADGRKSVEFGWAHTLKEELVRLTLCADEEHLGNDDIRFILGLFPQYWNSFQIGNKLFVRLYLGVDGWDPKASQTINRIGKRVRRLLTARCQLHKAMAHAKGLEHLLEAFFLKADSYQSLPEEQRGNTRLLALHAKVARWLTAQGFAPCFNTQAIKDSFPYIKNCPV